MHVTCFSCSPVVFRRHKVSLLYHVLLVSATMLVRFPHVCDLMGIFRDDDFTYVATPLDAKFG